MKKDCAFQYYRDGSMVSDTGLITRQEADDLWEDHKKGFKDDCFSNRDSEVALWIGMDNEVNYKETALHYNSSDVLVYCNELFIPFPS